MSKSVYEPCRRPFVVYVTFPNSSKEYCYLCNIPGIKQGDQVLANNTRVTVQRTANEDSRAARYVQPLPNQEQIAVKERKQAIFFRLNEIDKEVAHIERFTKLARKNAEAKKLLAELKKLEA